MLRALIVAAASGLVLVAGAAAAPAPRDRTFNGGVPLMVPLGTGAGVAGLALAPDGGFAVTGTAAVSGRSEPYVLRRTPTGAAEVAFGGGEVRSSFGDTADQKRAAAAVAIQPDGSVLIAGNTGGRVFVARYRPDGTLDPLFGAGGVAFTTTPSVTARAIAVRPDGRVLVAGSTPSAVGRSAAVVGFTAIGGLDSSFGSGGFVVTQAGKRGPSAPAASSANALALAADGTAWVGGSRTDPRGRARAFVQHLDATGAVLPFRDAARTLAAGLEINAVTATAHGVRVAGAATDVLGASAGLVAELRADGTRRWRRITQLGRPTKIAAAGSTLTALGTDGLVAGRTSTGIVMALRVAADGTIGCGGRTVVGGVTDAVTAAGNVIGISRRARPTFVGLSPAPGAARPEAPVTGRAERLSRKRVVVTGVVDPGCTGGRAVFRAGKRRVGAGRVAAGAGPQAVRAVARRARKRYRLSFVSGNAAR